MNRQDLIDEFLLEFKPKKDQSWKSCYFFSHFLKHKHSIDAELLEGISKINKIDYWVVRFDGQDEDIHAKATAATPDFIENPEVIWSLEEFEKDNF
ncbi:hypothetical protein N9M11_00975 [Flavobacteriaceae bacterium]|jgi:hypothetical protein|uniref:hypothetical protein n=1 Tax=Candidatus Arcticimaribacter forsetii TaxID=2820661 RepID=UPI0020770CFD|nr:hypothetical protein [Candidatus Arcticimaribacter forsetii]MCH1539272.1 hypothetical protein [Flavobacteriaceae bacterium]MDA8639643.1 hypothetical protein [Flavobacteriaceae bacterium]MDA8698682.1 hypothetical protein [Flavobacteriaceae bacterium]MDB2329614.1 hypothetical protein [Flavobacteriaceae bacterium]MDB2346030.1 hypothetical protein [Flavobacteriaceae bacterium]